MKASALAKELKRLRRSAANLKSFLHGFAENEGECIPKKLHEICKNTVKTEKSIFHMTPHNIYFGSNSKNKPYIMAVRA